MADEEKKVDTETTTEVIPEEKKTDGTDPEGKPEGEPTDTTIDYKARFEVERKAREESDKKIAEMKEKARERWKTKEDEIEGEKTEFGLEPDEKPLTARQLEEILAKQQQDMQQTFQANKIEQLADAVTGNQDEKNLILEIHKNRTWPSYLSLEQQIKESYAIANSERIIGENEELKRALLGKNMTNKNSANTHHDALPGGDPKMSAADKMAIEQSGYVYNNITRRYEKKLGGGEMLIYSPKTKQTYRQKASK